MRKRINNIIVINILVFICIFAAGCGFGRMGEYTEAGYNEISNYDFYTALESFDAAVEHNEEPQLIARGRGIAQYYLMNYEASVNYFLESLSYTSGILEDINFDTNFYLAQSYEKMGQYENAIDAYSSIIDIHTKDIMAHYLRGTDYLIIGNHDAAIEDFDIALKNDENNYDLRIEIAGRLSENYYEEEGKKYLQNFLVEKEKKLNSYDKGRIYYYMGEYEQAKGFLDDARDDDDQNTALFLGKTYQKLGDYNYASSVYLSFLKRHPDNAIIYNELGVCKIESRMYPEALEAFEAGRKIENNGIEQTLLFNEIVACEYNGNFAKAKSLMDTYISKYPDDANAIKEKIFLATR